MSIPAPETPPSPSIDELTRENAALKAELARLNASLRMRAASLVVRAVTSPRAALGALGEAWALVKETLTTRAWRRLVVALECGLPDDPLRDLTPAIEARARIERLERLARRGAAPEGSDGGKEAPVARAAERMRELAIVSRDGLAWPGMPAAGADLQQDRVLMALHAGQPDVLNGYARRSHELLKALLAKGWDITAVLRQTLDASEDAAADGVRYLRCSAFAPSGDGLRAYQEAYAGALTERAVGQRPALIHAASNHITGYAAARAARAVGAAFIYEVRGLWQVTRVSVEPRYEGSLGYHAQERAEIDVAKAADQLIVNGEPLADYFASAGVARSRIHVAPNGCTPEDFDDTGGMAETLRVRWGLGDAPVIGFVGSLTPYEGLADVFAACARLTDTPHQLLLVGDGPARPELEAAAARFGVADRARFTGRVAPEEARAAYGLIDIAPIVRPDLPVARLTPPLKPLEAMAGGSAVVLSDTAGLASFAGEGRAVVTPSGDVTALSQVLRRLLAQPAERQALAAAGRAWVSEHRRWSAIAEIVERAYRAAL